MFHFPPPSQDEAFEALVASLLQEAYGYQISRVGRSGQAQSGIDFLVNITPTTLIGVQCKKRQHRLTARDVIADVERFAEHWVGDEPTRTFEFLVCTTAPSDSSLQLSLNRYANERSLPFDLNILFWQDLERLLSLKAPDTCRQFYAAIGHAPTGADVTDTLPPVTRERPVDIRLATVSRRWREVNSVPPNSVILDHSTLGLASDLLASGVSGSLFSNFHYSAVDQLVEALVLNDRICLPRCMHPARWERGPRLEGIGDVVQYLDCPGSLDDDITDATIEWALNFWSSRSSRGFLSKLLHTHIEIHNEFTPPSSGRSLSMLANESRAEVQRLCRRLWSRFKDESPRTHRTLLGGKMLSEEEWSETLERLEPVCLSLIYWMFYRTFYYSSVGLAAGGVSYFCNPLRAAVIAFEAAGRNSSVSGRAISLIKAAPRNAKLPPGVPPPGAMPYWRASIPPVTHLVLNRCRGNLSELVPTALELRKEAAVVAFRAELAELHRLALTSPAAVQRKLSVLDALASTVARARENEGRSSRLVAAVRRGIVASRAWMRPDAAHVAFFKSLVESVYQNNYMIPFFCPTTNEERPHTARQIRRARILEANANRKFETRSRARQEKSISERMRTSRDQMYEAYDAGERTLQTRSLIVRVFGGYGS